MKNKSILFAAILLNLGSCTINKVHKTAQPVANATDKNSNAGINEPLPGHMHMKNTIKEGDAVLLQFTVLNNTTAPKKCCKWFTPFEPLMGEYLEIKNESGIKIPYQGPMAKRVMPPPESSYLVLNPKDSVSASLDLSKAYAIKAPGTYTITYTGHYMSNIIVKESISFVYEK